MTKFVDEIFAPDSKWMKLKLVDQQGKSREALRDRALEMFKRSVDADNSASICVLYLQKAADVMYDEVWFWIPGDAAGMKKGHPDLNKFRDIVNDYCAGGIL